MTPRLARLAASLALSLAASASFAQAAPPTLVVEDGLLTGAKGVTVGNKLYDVSFFGGSCNDAFGECSMGTKFTFSSDADAVAASNALAAYVLVNDPVLGTFDSSPSLVRGCETAAVACMVLTPYEPYEYRGQTLIFLESINNLPLEKDNGPGRGYRVPGYSDTQATWAVWQPSISAVPEPGGMALAAVALGAAFMSRRRVGAR